MNAILSCGSVRDSDLKSQRGMDAPGYGPSVDKLKINEALRYAFEKSQAMSRIKKATRVDFFMCETSLLSPS